MHTLRIPHFEIKVIQCLTDTLLQGYFMAKLDLEDAYLTTPMDKQICHFLRFTWEDNISEFTSLPFRLGLAPLVFTKLLKSIATILRGQGIGLHIYLEDMLLMAQSRSQL